MLSLTHLAAAMLAGCGGDDSSSSSSTSPDSGASGTTGTTDTTPTLSVLPSPAYSGFDGTHKFQIPLKVNGKTGATWKVDKPDLVDVVATADGAMLTTKGAGSVIVTATLGTETGSSKLEITAHTAADWDVGDKRYNDGVVAIVIKGDGGMPMGPDDIQYNKDGACTSCHGATASFLKVQHTPYQTGGYSDDELTTIFTKGMKPAGVVQRSFIPAYYWGMFHTWNASDAEKVGLVTYLRALAPVSQTTVDFPMRQGADGGPAGPPGAGGPSTTTGSDAAVHDAGEATASDAGAASDAH